MSRLLTVFAVALISAQSWACMCAAYDPENTADIDFLAKNSAIIALVSVVEVSQVSRLKFESKFALEESIKGTPAGPLSLLQDFSAPCVCDPRLTVGNRYLVFLDFEDGVARQSGPVVSFPDAQRFVDALRHTIEDD